MRRVAISERGDWRAKAAALGFAFHSPDGSVYWDERAYWELTLTEVERDLEAPTEELENLCRLAVDRAVRDERRLGRLGIPTSAFEIIRASWRRGDPSLYGRFDFAYDGSGPAKLLEYNADTPTALYEAAVFQWHWLEAMIAAGTLPKTADQFNSIHEKLVARFAELAGQGVLHLAAAPDLAEDRGTVAYIEDCARQGGFETCFIALADIGLDGGGRFVDLDDRPIQRLFKLYPWEWIFAEPALAGIAAGGTGCLEPPWKAVLSNKGLLALLWEMAPGHPNLLECYFADDPRAKTLADDYAVKPLYSREGANIVLVAGGREIDRDAGPYGAEGYVRQKLARLAMSDGNYAVIGAWVIAGEPAGIGIREDRSPITKNTSRFVPHAIVGA